MSEQDNAGPIAFTQDHRHLTPDGHLALAEHIAKHTTPAAATATKTEAQWLCHELSVETVRLPGLDALYSRCWTELTRLEAVEKERDEYKMAAEAEAKYANELKAERDQLRAQVEQAITMLQAGMPEFDASDVLDVLRNGAKQAALTTRQPEPAGDAVAWRDPSNHNPTQSVTFKKEVAEKWPQIYKQPLYTHPPAVSPAPEWVQQGDAQAIQALRDRIAELERELRNRQAPAPAVPKGEVELNIIRYWPDGFADELEKLWLGLVGFIPNYKLYDLQRLLDKHGFTMTVVDRSKAATPTTAPAQTDEQGRPMTYWGGLADQKPAQEVGLTDADIDATTRHIYCNGKPTSKEYRVGIARASIAALRAKGQV